MNANLIVVTGCFGAPVKEKSLELARQRGLPLVDLDNEITKRDGRSIGETAGEGLVLLVRRGKEEFIPNGDTVLHAGDGLVLLRTK